MAERWGPYDKQHDVDVTRVEEMPCEQGAYDNGWQDDSKSLDCSAAKRRQPGRDRSAKRG
jgi:hypothetical protein